MNLVQGLVLLAALISTPIFWLTALFMLVRSPAEREAAILVLSFAIMYKADRIVDKRNARSEPLPPSTTKENEK